jgi:hypothetical protein
MRAIILIVGALIMAGNVHAIGGKGVIILENISLPDEVYPGDNITISFYARNSWYGDLRNVYVYLEGGHPFLKTSPTEPKRIKELEWSWMGSPSVPMSFNLTVDKTAKAGSYTVNVVFTYTRYSDATGTKGGFERFKQVEPLTIKVRGRPDLKVVVKSSTPEKIRPGDLAKIRVSVVNIGSEEVKNVLLHTKAYPPVDLLWYSETLYINEVPPQGQGSVTMTVDVEEDAAAGRYYLPLTISYEDGYGKRVEVDSVVPVSIEETADYKITPVLNEVITGERDRKITFNLTNIGSVEAEELKTVLKASYPFTPTGNEYFVGTLKPQSTIELSFHVDVDDDASVQRYPVDIIFQWKENGKDYSKKMSTYVYVAKAEERGNLYALGLLIFLFSALALKKFGKRRT